MKNLLCLSFTLFIHITAVFAQGKIAQKSYQSFEPDGEGWITNSLETWDYDQADRETVYTTWTDYQGPFAPYNNTSVESVYHSNGQLEFQKNRNWGDTIWQESQSTYEYDEGDKLVNIIHKNEQSQSEIISYYQSTYEYDAAMNRQTEKYYSTTETPENWKIQHQRDNFSDDNDCLTKATILNFNNLGEQYNERWTINEVDENCQVQQSEYWLLDGMADTMYLHTRHNFSYTNGGKTQTDIYEIKNHQANEWRTQHLVAKTVDEAGREVRYFYELYKTSYTDTVLKITTYTEMGELETFREYKTAYQSNDNPLYIVRFDSLAYQYDDAGKLTQKEEFNEYYSGLPRRRITRYAYYCNGQLKTETLEELPRISRIHYEYYGNTDCFLSEDESPNLTVYPNPSDGNITIKSNLLSTLGAKVELHSVVGQLIYTEKVNRIAPTFQLELPELPKGQYVLTIRNEKEMKSEKLMIY